MMYEDLTATAKDVRRLILKSIHAAGSGHPGGSLSCTELLTWLFHRVLDPQALIAGEADRNRFVLSKGHAAPALYAAAATVGIIDPGDVCGLRRLGAPLQGHPDPRFTPWVEAATGSLGQGLSSAIGMALGMRRQGWDAACYTLAGDGEMQEGQVWEAAMFAAHQGLSNCYVIVDYNKLQSDDTNENICGLEPLTDKWAAFGWHVQAIDGHDFLAIDHAFAEAHAEQERPSVIIAHTIKGQGVGYMAGKPNWHGSVVLSDEELELALADVDAAGQGDLS